MSRVIFTPSSGATLTFETGNAADYRLVDLQGIALPPLNPFTVKGPRQPGETLADVIVAPRIVELTGRLQAATEQELWNLRAAAIATLSVQPARLQGSLSLGLLTVEIDNMPVREIDAIAQSAELIRPRGAVPISPIDVEFYCPFPYWRPTADTTTAFVVNDTTDITNHGDVDTPIQVQFTGTTFTQVKIRNMTTGEDIIVDYTAASEDYLEVTTGYGDKRVQKLTAGTAVSRMQDLDAADSIMWQLRPGVNSVKFECTGDAGATVDVIHRPLYSGL